MLQEPLNSILFLLYRNCINCRHLHLNVQHYFFICIYKPESSIDICSVAIKCYYRSDENFNLFKAFGTIDNHDQFKQIKTLSIKIANRRKYCKTK